MKFGGTSIGTPERMHNVAKLIDNSERKIVILSALSGTTDALEELVNTLYQSEIKKASEIVEKLEAHYIDFIDRLYAEDKYKTNAKSLFLRQLAPIKSIVGSGAINSIEKRVILAQGELISTQLFYFYLKEQGISATQILALDFMRLGKRKEPNIEYIERLLNEKLDSYPNETTFITQGYICRSYTGEIDNLKRGGSDYSASLMGSVVKADEVQIWTDIDGMHNNDPRFVEGTYPISELSFETASELAYFGAKILHPSAILPVQEADIPMRLKNSLNPEAKGTYIASSVEEPQGIQAIAAKDGITALKIKSTRMLMAYGFLRKIFDVFERNRTPIDVITTSEVAVSLTIDNTKFLEQILEGLERFGTIEVDENLSIICIVGNFVVDQQGLAAEVFNSLKEIPIRMISFGGSKHNISILVSTEDKEKALNLLNEGLFANS